VFHVLSHACHLQGCLVSTFLELSHVKSHSQKEVARRSEARHLHPSCDGDSPDDSNISGNQVGLRRLPVDFCDDDEGELLFVSIFDLPVAPFPCGSEAVI
jgi:hypothetical protein